MISIPFWFRRVLPRPSRAKLSLGPWRFASNECSFQQECKGTKAKAERGLGGTRNQSRNLSLSVSRKIFVESEILLAFFNLAAARATGFRNPNPPFLLCNRAKKNGHGRLRVSKVDAKSAEDETGGRRFFLFFFFARESDSAETRFIFSFLIPRQHAYLLSPLFCGLAAGSASPLSRRGSVDVSDCHGSWELGVYVLEWGERAGGRSCLSFLLLPLSLYCEPHFFSRESTFSDFVFPFGS